MEILIWLGIMILFLIIEAITVGLTTIWFAAGAFIALIASMLGANIIVQILLFFAVSSVLLFFTRPVAVRYFNPDKIRTNYEDTIDKTVKITRCVNNRNDTGTAVLNGLEWTARTRDDNVILQEGALAKVVAVEGVKLILVPAENEILPK